MKCSICNCEIKDGSDFCSRCGKKIQIISNEVDITDREDFIKIKKMYIIGSVIFYILISGACMIFIK